MVVANDPVQPPRDTVDQRRLNPPPASAARLCLIHRPGFLGFVWWMGWFRAEIVIPPGHDGSMAAVLTIDTGSHPSGHDVDQAVAAAFGLLAQLPARVGVPLIQKYRQHLTGIEADLLAETITNGGGDTKLAEKVLAKSGKVSRSAAKKSIARAKLNAKNPAIADKLASAELTEEQVDVIADTDRKTDGAAGNDPGFIDAIAKAGVDQSRGVAADFITNHANADRTQTEFERQRLLRKATTFTTDRRTKAILLDGDTATIDRIWALANQRADESYRNDGGRDIPVTKHPRTHEQRLFDALVDLIDNPTPTSTADAGHAGKRYTPKATTTRPVVVITTTLDKFAGLDPDTAAEMIGTGPIADTVLAQHLAADPDIVAMIFGLHGQPLWLSRNTRLASHAQHLALIVRDKRCVLCGAHHHRCKAHHIMPWNAPAKGETDITKLVLVCDSCHHHIHDNQQTIYHNPTNHTWQLRPALPHEIAPPRPPQPAKGQAPQRT